MNFNNLECDIDTNLAYNFTPKYIHKKQSYIDKLIEHEFEPEIIDWIQEKVCNQKTSKITDEEICSLVILAHIVKGKFCNYSEIIAKFGLKNHKINIGSFLAGTSNKNSVFQHISETCRIMVIYPSAYVDSIIEKFKDKIMETFLFDHEQINDLKKIISKILDDLCLNNKKIIMENPNDVAFIVCDIIFTSNLNCKKNYVFLEFKKGANKPSASLKKLKKELLTLNFKNEISIKNLFNKK